MSSDVQKYGAASIDAKVKVEAWPPGERGENDSYAVYPAKRTVEMSFVETFGDDAELDAALATFTEAVKAAARREQT